MENLSALLEELSAREPLFHRRAFWSDRASLEAMTAPDFWEVGASGRVYERDFVIETVLGRATQGEPQAWPCREFRLRQLGERTYLLTYLLEEPLRTTRRATIWECSEAGWRAVYHQGTLVE